MNFYRPIAFTTLLFAGLAQAQTPSAPNSAPPPLQWGPGIKVLMSGGTWAHDFQKWDNKWDTALLNKAGITSVHYSENSALVARELPHADVFIISANGGFTDKPFAEALTNFVESGKGLILLHSGSFYAGKGDWFYDAFAGAGAGSHDGPGQFEETVVKDHPITKGLPQTFKITDELYHIVPRPHASPIDVLVYAQRPGGPKYPSVWTVNFGQGRIASIALGHDGYPRKTPEFSMLLTNAVLWAAGK